MKVCGRGIVPVITLVLEHPVKVREITKIRERIFIEWNKRFFITNSPRKSIITRSPHGVNNIIAEFSGLSMTILALLSAKVVVIPGVNQ